MVVLDIPIVYHMGSISFIRLLRVLIFCLEWLKL